MLDGWAAVITRWRVSRRAETWHMMLPTIRQTVGPVTTASGSSNCGGRVVGGRAGGGVPLGRMVRTVNVHRVPVRLRIRSGPPTHRGDPRLMDGRAARKLVFATMVRTTDHSSQSPAFSI